MLKKAALIILCLCIGSFGACVSTGGTTGGESKPEPQKITAEEAKKRMDSGNVLVVDVRSQEEYDAGHIDGAILIPLDTISDTRPEALPDLNAEILVYCRSGVRSKNAAGKLAAIGYTNVFDMGGIIDWPFETTSATS